MQLVVVDQIATLTMSNPKGNAINPSFLATLEGLINALEASTANACIITGQGRFFSVGLDLPLLGRLPRAELRDFMRDFSRVMTNLFATTIPLVAAINGHAIAGGCVIAQQADIRIMADGPYQIGLKEAQIGIGLPIVVTETLRAFLPSGALVDVAYRGKLFSPEDALSIGLIEQTIRSDQLMEKSLAVAEDFGKTSAAIRQIKWAVRQPIIDRIRRHEAASLEQWLDTWFNPESQQLIAEIVQTIR